MAKNEDGQFELTLGNRQLLSVFFIVVILLGVFFTMGYIVGKNSAPIAAEIASTRQQTGKPLVVDSPAHTPEGSPVVESPGARAPEVSRPEPAKTTPIQTKSEIPVKQAPAKEEPPKQVTRAEKKAEKKETKSIATTGQPTSGATYLQLAATSKHEADVMIEVLQGKGFRALAAEIPDKPGTFRVLVGPVQDGAANKTRADLQSAGFPGNAAIRRVF